MKLDLVSYIEKQLKNIKQDIDFAYNSGQLDEDDGHTALQKIITQKSLLIKIIENSQTAINSFDSDILIYYKKILMTFTTDIDFAYPDNQYNNDYAHITFSTILNSINHIGNFNSVFIKENIKHIYEIDYLPILKNHMNCIINDVEYSFDGKDYIESNGHVSSQMIYSQLIVFNNMLKMIETNNDKENDIITLLKKENKKITKIINNVYNEEEYFLPNEAQEILYNVHKNAKEVIENIKDNSFFVERIDIKKEQSKNNTISDTPITIRDKWKNLR